MQTKPLFVTGIGTYVGKTIVSAVLCEQLKADYWKPVQSGDLDNTDSDQVKKMLSNTRTVIHPETFRLDLAASPHQSAKAQGLEITPAAFSLPQTENQLLVEGAGGLFVPLSTSFLMTDLIRQLGAEVVLVVRNYLGCINHTLLSLQTLAGLQIPLKHVILNGDFNTDTRDVIIHHIPEGVTWSELPELSTLNRWSVAEAPVQIPLQSTF
ncbi:dethiobiotin synthetase [Pedobacter westerhofensis]|uniref:ATP-dependent dethiobiotin synthetase BioD n=1 Tax=Pedobacter westerhofensis TaxID=425512 RepID=A0A521FGD8_9SPHI|nr:dethiobiotin synthase [Pedobacter westerhofensis]SMO95242.1 dethiobiotin synthetase [Pedobacter westerhofensis]